METENDTESPRKPTCIVSMFGLPASGDPCFMRALVLLQKAVSHMQTEF